MGVETIKYCLQQSISKKNTGGWLDGWMGGKSRFKDCLQQSKTIFLISTGVHRVSCTSSSERERGTMEKNTQPETEYQTEAGASSLNQAYNCLQLLI